jgi:short-subunit dehydrogenase
MAAPLNEQVVVIVGASSGIGRAAAEKFAQAGAKLVLAARGEEALNTVAEEIRIGGGQVIAVPADIAYWPQVEAIARQAVEAYGRIDTWVNDAAVSQYGTVEDTPIEDIERVIDVNLMGTIHGIKAALPYMRRQGQGTIINIGSVLSQRSVPLQAAYCASKHGVKGFSEALRLELKRDYPDIHVTVVFPASINTPLFRHAKSDMGVRPMPIPPVYQPELVADAIVSAAVHPKRRVYAGDAAVIFSLSERISPALTDRIMMIGSWIFKTQKSKQPDDGQHSLYDPLPGSGSVHGDFGHLSIPSVWTRLFEMGSGWRRLLMPVALIGSAVVALFRRQGEASS